jgi:hypothetical protein
MDELYHLYVDNEYHLDYLLKIYYFLLRNQIDFKEIESVLHIAYDITKLYQTRSNLVIEIEQMKDNYLLNQNTNRQQVLPLGLPKYCYEQY